MNFIKITCAYLYFKPKSDWGPALTENRTGRYVAPFSDVTNSNGSAPANDYVMDMKGQPQEYSNQAYVAEPVDTVATKF